MNIAIEFIEKYLPEHILNNYSESIEILSKDEQEIEEHFSKLWSNFRGNNEEFPLSVTNRNSRNKTTNVLEKMVLIKINSEKSNEETFVSSVIYLNINKVLKYFILEEIDKKILPITFIKNNERYLLKEIELDNKIINWGKIINPKNLSSVINSISSVVS